jgi:ribose transport system substrate-binding protein
MKKLILAALAATVLTAPAWSADTYRFAIVPKAMNNPYFDLSRDGCNAEAKKLGNVECVYIGPVEHEPATQVQIINDLISQGVDGIAVAVSDANAAKKVIQNARDAGIPIITFDADAPDSARQAHVGTDNKAFGRQLGEELKRIRPQGGTFGMISGGPAAANLADRVEGVREALKGSNWTEISGSPLFCNDDLALSVQQMQDMATANPDINAIIPVGGWPMFVPEAYKSFVNSQKARMESGDFVLVVADTLPVQIQLLDQGFADTLVGQQPYEMGRIAMDLLLKLKTGEAVPEITYADLEIVTPENVKDVMKAKGIE